MNDTEKQKISDFSPQDIAIQIMKAIEVADISDFNGKNVFEASAYDDIFNAIVYGIEESNKLAIKSKLEAVEREIRDKWTPKKTYKDYGVTKVVMTLDDHKRNFASEVLEIINKHK